MPHFELHFDRISFWLGFTAATLFWWLISRIRPLVPVWIKQIRELIKGLSLQNLAGVEEYLRREAIHRAQRQHVAAPLFPLDEILIEPKLIPPPKGQNPEEIDLEQSVAGQIIPYLPDWPELVANFSVPTVTPAEAVQSGRHLVIIGQPGSGKTVALAHLAGQIARADLAVGECGKAVPLYLHALDLDTTQAEGVDPLQNLIKSVNSSASVVMQPQIQRYLQTILRGKERQIILLLDGLDELSLDSFTAVTAFLHSLISKLPRLQVVTTTSSDLVDGLTHLGFYPLTVAAWSSTQRMEFAKKWGGRWTGQLLPESKKQATANEIDPLLMDYWLQDETAYNSPLEWTLRVWGAYAGDLSGSNSLGILDNHIARFLPKPAFMPALEQLAHLMVEKQSPCLGYGEVEQMLSVFRPIKPGQFEADLESDVFEPALAAVSESSAKLADKSADSAAALETPDAVAVNAVSTEDEDPLNEPAAKTNGKPKKTARKGRKEGMLSSQGEQIINSLIEGGILVEHSGHRLRFTSPVFLGFLGCMQTSADEADEIARKVAKKIEWPIHLQVLHYGAACSDNPDWVHRLIGDPTAPLFHNLLVAAHWLADAPLKAEWRNKVMRTLVSQIQNETLPMGTRARLMAAVLLSRDPSTIKLLKQLLVSKSPNVRRIALLGCGGLGSSQLLADVLELLGDLQRDVRYTACLTLAAIPGDQALSALVELLLSGDEDIRQAAAEALAQNKPDGEKVLEEAAGHEDLLTRRAAVFGLVQVREAWSQKVLEKMAVEDGQWVVRNAAAQALETFQQASPKIPEPLPTASNTGWLLTFASKLGMGILPGQPATDVLLTVLKSGSIEEQIAALCYLREQSDEGVVGAIYGLLYSGVEELKEPALLALWWISITGAKIPSPTQFGLG